ncbi:MAG: cellulase family glycosylhydrolase [Actinobacteria bacterium]|nr:cellulase family glycosylhydrolase [Actinomycetota bacterium]
MLVAAAIPCTVVAATVVPKAPPAVGVQFHCTWTDYTNSTRTSVADRLRAASVQWVRIDVGWKSLRPRRGSIGRAYQTRLDNCVDLARRRGFRVLLTLGWTPRWASADGDDRSPPTQARDYAAIAQWLARRYRGRVAAYEVWNEPNLTDFWTGTVEDYVRVLRAAYPAFKRGDRKALVVFGGPSGNDDVFIRRAYAAGARGSFDVMATHPYQGSADAPPEYVDDGERWWLTHVPSVRRAMIDAGDAKKPIWFTETGWSAHANDPDTARWRLGVDERIQADYATRMLRLVRTTYPYVTHVFWYSEWARLEGEDVHLRGFGLLRPDLSPRPVYDALKNRP